jgi:signal transduction histidine kinase
MAVVALVTRGELLRPWLAALLVCVALGVTAATTVALRRDYRRLLAPAPALAELACGLVVVVADGWAYRAGHVFGPSQTLGVIWPLSGVLAVGVAMGAVPGAAAGSLFGAARLGDAVANGVNSFDGHRVLSLVSTALVYASAGAVVGYLTRLLRRAREEVAVARAREEVARALHDGVLQTLAVIERRTAGTEVARIARQQERELRDYLFSASHRPGPSTDLAVALRAAVARFEESFGSPVDLLLPDDLPALGADTVSALAGAVSEALTNAGKHGGAQGVTVYLEPSEPDGVFCSVRDDGRGFDPATTEEGIGLNRSVRARMAEVGGRVCLKSAPGQGTEVCLWVR